ncbi:hypothetical protein GGF50DRAFT_130734 [Schizophyllum commune]
MDIDYEMIPGLGRDEGYTGMDQNGESAGLVPNESSESNPDDEIPGLGGAQPASVSCLPEALTSVLDIPNEDVETVDLFATIDAAASTELPETSLELHMALLKLRKLGVFLHRPLPTFWRALIPRVVPQGLPPLISRLPTELLSTIFAFLVKSELYTKSRTPVQLSHECDGQRACARRKVAELYTERARMLPLEVAFCAKSGPRPNICACTLDLVLSIMPRTQGLSLHRTTEYALLPLSRVPAADKARLERLRVFLDQAIAKRPNTDLVAGFAASAPVLRHLCWHERIPPTGIPYARMTVLALERCPLNEEDVLRILRAAPALTVLDVNLFAAPSFSHPPLTHPTLQFFGLAGEDARDGLLSALSFPALRRLWMRTSERPVHVLWPVRNAEVWLAFLGRMVRGLEALELIDVPMGEETLLRSLMLPQLAGLRNLYVRGDTLIAGYDVFQLLRPDPVGSVAPALPNLRYLRLGLCRVCDGVVGQILQTRFEYGMPMSRVVIRFFGTCEEHSKDSAIFRQLSASQASKVICKFFAMIDSHLKKRHPAPERLDLWGGSKISDKFNSRLPSKQRF